MSILDSILDKLGLQKKQAAKTPAAPRAMGNQPAYTPPPSSTFGKPAPMAMVDVMSKLEGMAKKNPMKLNWKESIVDLLVVLGLPHSGKDLQELAVELKCPEPTMSDSFKRNMWLHKAVLKQIAENGGNIPKNLLD